VKAKKKASKTPRLRLHFVNRFRSSAGAVFLLAGAGTVAREVFWGPMAFAMIGCILAAFVVPGDALRFIVSGEAAGERIDPNVQDAC
jgi:hypothetical protein